MERRWRPETVKKCEIKLKEFGFCRDVKISDGFLPFIVFHFFLFFKLLTFREKTTKCDFIICTCVCLIEEMIFYKKSEGRLRLVCPISTLRHDPASLCDGFIE